MNRICIIFYCGSRLWAFGMLSGERNGYRYHVSDIIEPEWRGGVETKALLMRSNVRLPTHGPPQRPQNTQIPTLQTSFQLQHGIC